MPPRKRAGASTHAPARKHAAKRRIAPPRRPALRPKRRTSQTRRTRKFYTAEFLAEAQRRIEQTSQSMTAIAGNFGMHHSVLSRLAARKGWVRPDNSGRRRSLSGVMRLAAAADELERAAFPPPERGRSASTASRVGVFAVATPTPTLPLAGGGSPTESAAPASPHTASAPDTATLARLEAAVLKELSVVERMRASLGAEPLRPMDAERTSRTLSVLTETLAKLRRLRLAANPAGSPDHDDDFDSLPAGIDDFRDALARRIELFVASRSDAARAGGDPPAVVDAARP
jgi:hypothetical protein